MRAYSARGRSEAASARSRSSSRGRASAIYGTRSAARREVSQRPVSTIAPVGPPGAPSSAQPGDADVGTLAARRPAAPTSARHPASRPDRPRPRRYEEASGQPPTVLNRISSDRRPARGPSAGTSGTRSSAAASRRALASNRPMAGGKRRRRRCRAASGTASGSSPRARSARKDNRERAGEAGRSAPSCCGPPAVSPGNWRSSAWARRMPGAWPGTARRPPALTTDPGRRAGRRGG